MKVNENSSGGGSASGSGGTGGQANGAGGHEQDDGDDEEPNPKLVPYDRYSKTVTESKNRLSRIRELESKLTEFESKVTDTERKKLEEQGEYKKLLESERTQSQTLKQQLAEFQKKLTDFEDREVARRKYSALQKSLGGQIDSKYAALIDFDSIAVDPESGEVDEVSVGRYAETFKKTFPEIVLTQKGTGLPNGKPGAGRDAMGMKKILESEWNKLATSKEMKAYKPDDIIWGK